MKRELQRCRILCSITDASSGMGRCLAEQLAAAGGRMAVAARSADKLDELVRSAEGQEGEIIAIPADVTVESHRQRMLDAVVDYFGGLDVLVNNGLSQHLLRNTGRAKTAFDQGMPPEQVASAIVEALRKNRTESVVERDARWMLRAGRFFPRLVDRLLARRVRKLYAT